jgi:8-amino-7-oxononanoate synthase
LFEPLQQGLDTLESEGLRRFWRSVEAVEGSRLKIGGRWVIHLASNGYLGLHLHPRVKAAAREAIDRFGAGAASARLIGGTFSLHEELEAALAKFKQTEAALLFPTGYMANLGAVTSLVGPGDLVVGDALNHASLIDACRLSKAAFRVYPHRDADRLDACLKLRRKRRRNALIVTEGLFSMDGDIAPLTTIAEIARRHGAWLLVDDAHATGVLGKAGRGSLDHFGIPPGQILQMGTLSKALGSLGGFVAGPRAAIEWLKNKARSFVYTTALPPASAAAALAALRVIQEEPSCRARLKGNAQGWILGLKRLGLDLISEESPIVPIRVGHSQRALKLASDLFEAGVFAPGIRPPTVPKGSARIRTSLTALHSGEDLDQALAAFGAVFAHA